MIDQSIFSGAAQRLDISLGRFFEHTGRKSLDQVNETNVSVQIAVEIGIRHPSLSVIFERQLGGGKRVDVLGVEDGGRVRFVIESKRDIDDIGLNFCSSLSDAVRMKRSHDYGGVAKYIVILVSEEMIEGALRSARSRFWKPLHSLLDQIYRGDRVDWNGAALANEISKCLDRRGRAPKMVARWIGVVRKVRESELSLKVICRARLPHSKAILFAALIS